MLARLKLIIKLQTVHFTLTKTYFYTNLNIVDHYYNINKRVL